MRFYLISLIYKLIDIEKELRDNKEYEWADKIHKLLIELQKGVIHDKLKR